MQVYDHYKVDTRVFIVALHIITKHLLLFQCSSAVEGTIDYFK